MRDKPLLPKQEQNEGDESYEMILGRPNRQPPSLRYYSDEAREPNAETDDFQEVLRFLQVLWRHKWILAASLTFGGLTALGISLYMTPKYFAQTSMQIETQQEPFGTSVLSQDPTLVTESQLMSSQTMRQRAAA